MIHPGSSEELDGQSWRGAVLRLKRLFAHLPTPVYVVSPESEPRVLFWNEAFERAFGYTLDATPTPTLADWLRLCYPDNGYRAKVSECRDVAVARAVQGAVDYEPMSCRVTCWDGGVREAEISEHWIEGLVVTVVVDVTQRDARSEVEAMERTAYELTDHIPVGTYTMVLPPGAEMAHFFFMSERFLELTGLDRETARSDPLLAFACVHPDDYERWVELNARAFASKKRFFGETRVVVGGEVRWITAESAPRDLPDGSTVWEGVLADITERKRAELALLETSAALAKANAALKAANEKLTELAATDRLTGIFNRLTFETKADEAIDRGARYGESVSLILCDVDHFKRINDQFGHVVGDRVLVEYAQRIRSHLRAVDVLARWGGEEFVVMMPHCSLADAHRLAEKLRALIAESPFPEVGALTASFGVAAWMPGDDLDQWVKRADMALYAAKAGGRNRVEVHATMPAAEGAFIRSTPRE